MVDARKMISGLIMMGFAAPGAPLISEINNLAATAHIS